METTAIDPVTLINEAVSQHNWGLLVVAILLIVAPVVLHLMGKEVPIVSAVLNAAVGIFRRKGPAPEAPKPENQDGVSSVVKVEEEKKKEK